jgi:hypothetical protein
MSSLTGALSSPDTPYEKVKFKQDINMHSSSFDDALVTIFSPGGGSPVAL